jgi:hypothetical protein
LENGTPWLRANAQSCRDAAAREAIPAIVWQIIRTVAMTAEAARLCVVLKNKSRIGYPVVDTRAVSSGPIV